MSSNAPEDVKPMVNTYKKLFVILSVITLMGIAIVLLHAPWWTVLFVGLCFVALKSAIVYETFKNLMVGKNAVIILFGLTIFFLLHLLLLPVLNSKGHITGTVDISKQLMMEEPEPAEHAEEGHHGN